MSLRAFFISAFRDICVCAGFSGQNKFSSVTIFKKCLGLVLDLVQILYSIALQCVFPVLLFNPHTSDLVWMKADYNVQFLMLCPSLLPSLLRTGGAVVLGCLLQGLERHRRPASPPSSMLWCWGRQLPVATTSWGHECHACCFLLFPPEFWFIAITSSANVEPTPEETKQVHSVIEDLVQCQWKPKICFPWPKRRLGVGRRKRRREEEECQRGW